MTDETQSLDLARAELTPVGGVLRAGFNMGNALPVAGNTPEGYPDLLNMLAIVGRREARLKDKDNAS